MKWTNNVLVVTLLIYLELTLANNKTFRKGHVNHVKQHNVSGTNGHNSSSDSKIFHWTDHLKRKLLKYEVHSNEIDYYGIQLQLLKYIRKQLVSSIDRIIKPIVQKIHYGDSKKAASDVDNICDQTVLKLIVKSAYTSNCQQDEIKVQENIINFLSHLSRTLYIKIGFNELLKNAKILGQTIRSPKLCLLSKRLKGPVNGIDTDTLTVFEIRRLDWKIKRLLKETGIKTECQKKKNNKIIHFDETREEEDDTTKNPEQVDDIKKKIVYYYKGDINNIDNVMKHIKTLPNTKDVVKSTIELIKEMEKHQHFDTNELINVVSVLKAESGKKEIKMNKKFLKQVPLIVNELLWKGNENGRNCWLQNIASYEFLHVNGEPNKNGSKTVQTVPREMMDSYGNWHLKSFTIKGSVVFSIFNTKFNEYLYHSRVENTIGVYLKSGKCTNEDCYWQIVPAKNATFLQIKNKHGVISTENQNAFVIKMQSLNQNNLNRTFWNLECKNNTERINSVYNGTKSNINQAMVFIESITDNSEKMEAFKDVLKTVVQNNDTDIVELVHLSALIKQEMEKNEEDKTKMEEILKHVPIQLQELIWKANQTNCWVKNRGTEEYFYADGKLDESSYRIIYAVSPNKTDSQGNLNFAIQNMNRTTSFRIRSSRFNECLFSSLVKDKQMLFTSQSNCLMNECLWKVVPVNNAKYIQIWNEQLQQVVVAPDFQSINIQRHIALMQPDTISEESIYRTHWTLECRNDSERILNIYEKDKNSIDHVLYFIKSLQSPEDVLQGIVTIKNKLSRINSSDSTGLIQLAQFVKNGMGSDIKVENLQRTFPITVQELIWKGNQINCWINNKAFNEYLYTPEENNEPREVFTMVLDNMDSFGNWLLITQAGKGFQIYNSRLNENLHDVSYMFNSTETKHTLHTIKTNLCHGNCNWIVTTVNGGEYIQIRAESNGHILFVDEKQINGKRAVYTINPKTIDSIYLDRTLWTLKCRNNSERVLELYDTNALNVEKILIFIKSLPDHRDMVQNTNLLLQEMIHLQHIDTVGFIQVAYFVKAFINNLGQNISLRSYFSPAIQELIWKGSEVNCWIKHKVKNEYFYIADKYNDNGRYVFTWIPGDVGTEGNWLFRPNKFASTFRIRSALYNEDLHPLDEQNSKENIRLVNTWLSETCGSNCDWEIVPADKAACFQIRNGNHDEYLVADDAYFEGSRSIFTIPITSVKATNLTYWTIECQTDAQRIESTYNGDLSNFNKSFAYLRSLRDKNKTNHGIVKMLNTMRSNSHLDSIQLFRLANFAKEYMQVNGFNETLKKQFPPLLQDIIWMKNDSKCWLVNEANNLMLRPNINGSVMISDLKIKDSASNWQLIPQDKNGMYIIQHVNSAELLSSLNSNETERSVNIKKWSKCYNECQWQLIPANNSQFVQIVAALQEQILNIEASVENLWNVSITLPILLDKSKMNNTYWKLDCKDDRDRLISLYQGLAGKFELAFSYIKSLSKPEAIINGIEILIKEMVKYERINTNEMLQLAYFAKGSEDKFQKEMFPIMIQNLVWADSNLKCWVKNKGAQSFLSTSSGLNDKQQRISLTVTLDNIENTANWLLKPHDNGKSYHIFNSGTKEYLHSISEGLDHVIFTFNNNSCIKECQWTLIPFDDKYMQIMFTESAEYLLVTDNLMIDIRSLNQNNNLELRKYIADSIRDNSLWSMDCQNITQRITWLYNGTLSNFQTSINYIESINDTIELRNASLTLMHQMKEHEHHKTSEFIELIHFIKKHLKITVTDGSIRDVIPLIVKELIWKKDSMTCWLHSKYLYLTTSHKNEDKSNLRPVYMSTFDEIRSTSTWNIHFEDETRNVRILNGCFGEYLYVLQNNSNTIYTTPDKTCEDECIWEIIPGNDGMSMQIKHKYHEMYLNVENHRLNLLPSSQISYFKPALWKLSCKSNVARIQSIYDKNISKFKTTLSYIQSLIPFTEIFEATETLLYEMIANQQIDNKEIIELAYFTRYTLDINGTSHLALKFPPLVQDLIWKCDVNKCKLRSVFSNEYLYSAYAKTNHTRRHVYTWIPGNKDSQCNWNFEPQSNSSLFAIKNIHFEEYIYSFSGKSEDEDRRPIFSWVPGNYDKQGMWEIYPANNGTHVKIKNTFVNEFLYADEPQDEARRKVVTWSGSSLDLNPSRILWTMSSN